MVRLVRLDEMRDCCASSMWFQGCLNKASSSLVKTQGCITSKARQDYDMGLQSRPHLQPEECLQGGTALCGAVRSLQHLQVVDSKTCGSGAILAGELLDTDATGANFGHAATWAAIAMSGLSLP